MAKRFDGPSVNVRLTNDIAEAIEAQRGSASASDYTRKALEMYSSLNKRFGYRTDVIIRVLIDSEEATIGR